MSLWGILNPITEREFLEQLPDSKEESIYLYEIADRMQRPPEDVVHIALEVARYIHLDYSTIPVGGTQDFIKVSHTLKSLSYLDLLCEEETTGYYPAIRRDAKEGQPARETYQNVHTFEETKDRYKWMVTGTAEHPLSEVCGHIRKVGACPDHPEHAVEVIRFGCKDTLCPVCWSSRNKRTVEDITDRLIGGFEAYYQYRGARFGSIQDFSVHPPPEQAAEYLKDPEAVRKFRADTKKMLKKIGFIGGVMIMHPWRVTQDAKQQYKADYQNKFSLFNKLNPRKEVSDGESIGIWSWLRGMGMIHADYIFFSPHFHVLGVMGGKFMKADQFHQETGWTYKHTMKKGQPVKFTPDKNRYWKCRDQLESKIFYLLSHQGIMWDDLEKKRPILNILWFGLYSSQKLKCDKGAKEWETTNCPVCEALLVEYAGWDQELDGDTWVPIMDYAVPNGEEWGRWVVPKTFRPT